MRSRLSCHSAGIPESPQYAPANSWELSDCFAIDVAGFAVLDNHLHLLVRISPERPASWSDEEVVRRWGRLFPPRGKDRKLLPVSEAWVKQKLADETFVGEARRRLADLGWFMKKN